MKRKYTNLDFENKVQLYQHAFGNEINGVAQNVIDNCDSVIEIPQYGTKHSLNISIACGIVVWDLWKQINN